MVQFGASFFGFARYFQSIFSSFQNLFPNSFHFLVDLFLLRVGLRNMCSLSKLITSILPFPRDWWSVVTLGFSLGSCFLLLGRGCDLNNVN